MTEQTRHPGDPSEPTLPQALIDDLGRLYGATVSVPPEVDEAIVGAARRRMVPARRARLVLVRLGIAVAAAAAVPLIVYLREPAPQPRLDRPVGFALTRPGGGPRASNQPSGQRPLAAAASRVPTQPSGPKLTEAGVAAATPVGPKDIDRNGRVDILDAFLLARDIQRHEHLEKVWDVNGDGVIDAKDVDAVALAAVSLKGGA